MASDRIRHAFKLPAEIRTMVYDQALANGDFNLSQVTNTIHDDIAPFIAPYKFFRLRIAYPYTSTPAPLGQVATAMVQNLVLMINLGPNRQSIDSNIVQYFGGSSIARQFCHVALDYRGHYDGFGPFIPEFPALFQALRGLTGFWKVRVMILHSLTDVQARLFPYALLLGALEPAFGPATYSRFQGAGLHFIEFQPSTFSARVNSVSA